MASDAEIERLRALVGDATFEGRFAMVREAGAGGMGRVLEAIDRDGERRVAIKLIDGRGLPDLQRFAAEAEILERLAHPRIVGYVAHGTTGRGEPYLAMEWLDGETLSARLRRGRLELDDVIALARQLGEALAYAHGQGVVHRDLKPSNVMLVGGAIADARLLDFGVAKGSDRDLTQTGQMIGTPGYMAPEQALGRRAIDGRADLFALGCTLYEALTGDSPFPGEEVMAVLARLLLHEPPAVDEVRAEVPPRLANLIAALMAKEPTARLSDAGVVMREAEALARARAIGDAAALDVRPHLIETAAAELATTIGSHRPPPRRRGPAIAAGLAAVVVLGGAALAIRGRATRPSRGVDAGANGTVAATEAAPLCTVDIRRGCAAACAAGDRDACYYQGEALALGFGGTAKDLAAAQRTLIRGCELGSGRACTKAGIRLLDSLTEPGTDVATAMVAAQRVLTRGCELGSGNTCRRLGVEYLAPSGRLGADDGMAIRSLSSACELGDNPSCWVLVELREGGRVLAPVRARVDAAIARACATGARHRVCDAAPGSSTTSR